MHLCDFHRARGFPRPDRPDRLISDNEIRTGDLGRNARLKLCRNHRGGPALLALSFAFTDTENGRQPGAAYGPNLCGYQPICLSPIESTFAVIQDNLRPPTI